MVKPAARSSSRSALELAREAYFLDFARCCGAASADHADGWPARTPQGMQAALDEGVDIVGLARPICVEPDAVRRLLAGEIEGSKCGRSGCGGKGLFSNNSPLALIRTVNSFAGIYWFYTNSTGSAAATRQTSR